MRWTDQLHGCHSQEMEQSLNGRRCFTQQASRQLMYMKVSGEHSWGTLSLIFYYIYLRRHAVLLLRKPSFLCSSSPTTTSTHTFPRSVSDALMIWKQLLSQSSYSHQHHKPTYPLLAPPPSLPFPPLFPNQVNMPRLLINTLSLISSSLRMTLPGTNSMPPPRGPPNMVSFTL